VGTCSTANARRSAVTTRLWIRLRLGSSVLTLSSLFTTPAVANGAHTGHQFSITETGGSTLTIPIQVPRGIGGMEPQLSFSYSSGAGNGLMGVGWTLAGPSAITRCPKTKVRDGIRGSVDFTTKDRFCLDGQRLVAQPPADRNSDVAYHAANTVYYTERDTFSRVTAIGALNGSPASFTVETKAGLVLEFGSSTDSRAMTTNLPTNVVNRWLLRRISDRLAVPNFVEFVYCAGEVNPSTLACAGTYTGSQVLRYVQYTNRGTANGTNAVVLTYEARPDRLLQFHAGSSQVQTQRLAYVSTHLGFVPSATPNAAPASLGTRVKVYELTYDPMTNTSGQWTRATNVSLVTRIQEVDGAATVSRPPPARTAANALPPLNFNYGNDMLYGKAVSQTTTVGTVAPTPASTCGGYLGPYRYYLLCQ
jgi:hypothetical protein